MEHTELKSQTPLGEAEHIWMDSFSDIVTPLPSPIVHDQHSFVTPTPIELETRLDFGTELFSTNNENQSFDFFENLPDVDTHFLASNFPEEIGTPLSTQRPPKRLGPWGKFSLAERSCYDIWADYGLPPSPSFLQLYSTNTKKKSADFFTNVQKMDSNLFAEKIPDDVPTRSSSYPWNSTNPEAEDSKETSSSEESNDNYDVYQFLTPSTSYSELISTNTEMQHSNVFESLQDLDTNLMTSQVLEEICTRLTNLYSSDHPDASLEFPIALRSRYSFCTDSQLEGHESFDYSFGNPSDQDTNPSDQDNNPSDHDTNPDQDSYLPEYECLEEVRPPSPNQWDQSYCEPSVKIPVGERHPHLTIFCFQNEWPPLPSSSQVLPINHENQVFVPNLGCDFQALSKEISNPVPDQWFPEYPEYPEAPEEISFFERSNYSVWTAVSQPHLLPHPTISCYTMLTTQFVGDVTFYLDFRQRAAILTPSLEITVLDPNNHPLRVETSLEKVPRPHRFICTFHAPTIGYYSASITDGILNLQIKGSPLIIPVCRNYRFILPPRVFADVAQKCWGIAYSYSVDRVYVADRDSDQVFIFNRDGSLDNCFGSRGSGRNRFRRPTGIAVDHRNQRLVISDKDNHRICVCTLDGRFLFTFGKQGYKNGEFNYPWGVAVSPKDSTIVIADSRNHRVQLFDEYGQFVRKFSVFETNPFEYKTEFNYPRGVCFDNFGDSVYVTDFNTHVVHKFNAELTEKRQIPLSPTLLHRPQGIAVDPVGNLLICDSRNNCIRVTTPKGERITSIYGRKGSSFFHPLDIDVSPTGQIVVVDLLANIRVL